MIMMVDNNDEKKEQQEAMKHDTSLMKKDTIFDSLDQNIIFDGAKK